MQNIEVLKARMEVKTSETLFDIEPQPKQQCPSINKMQANIEAGIKEIEHYSNSLRNIEGAESIVVDIEGALSYYFSDKHFELEELRGEIEKIRLWGEGWKNLAKSIINNEMKEEENIVHYFSSNYQIKYDESLLTGKKQDYKKGNAENLKQ
jgi:hypothetical protein